MFKIKYLKSNQFLFFFMLNKNVYFKSCLKSVHTTLTTNKKHILSMDASTENKFIIEKVGKKKELEVTIDSLLDFSEHINSKVSKAYPLLGLIFRTITFWDKKNVIILKISPNNG